MSLSEPSTPPEGVNNHITPIPKDTEQRFRSRCSASSDKTPLSHKAVAESGSYHKLEQNDKRRRQVNAIK